MKRLILTATAAIALFGIAAHAQPAPTAPPAEAPRAEQRGDRMERRAARMEERMNKRMERLKADLKLTPAQEPLWAPVQAQLRKMQDERRGNREGMMQRMRSAELPDRLDLMAERAARGATNMRELSATVKPLWATLDADQKQTVMKALPGAHRRGMGGEGRGHGGRN